MSVDRLRHDIESILRGYYRKGLGPEIARNPVLGALGIARAKLRESGDPLSDFKFFFESGAISVSNLGGGEYSSNLFINQRIVDGYTPTYDLNGIDGITDDDRLWLMGEVDIKTAATPLVGDIDAVSGDAGASRALSGAQRILTCSYVPASLFSGKLRLYVQSLYGLNRSAVQLSGSGLWPTISSNGFTFSYSGTESQWLYTTDDWRFFIVWPSFSSSEITFHFRELIEKQGLQTEEVALRTWAFGLLRDSFGSQQGDKEPWELVCLQTLVMALSSPATTDHSTVVVSKPSTTYPLGSPLAYGWHATWVGDQANIVLLNADTHTGAFASVTLAANVSATVSGDTVTFSATCTVESQLTAAVDNKILAWVPSGVYVNSIGSYLSPVIYQCPTATPGAFTISSPTANFNIPIYGWYTDTGAWNEVKIKKETATNNFTAYTWSEVIVCNGGSDERTAITGQGTATQWTVSTGGSSLKTVQQSVTRIKHRISKINPGSWSWTRNQGLYMTYGAYNVCRGGTVSFPGCSGCSGSATNWYHYQKGLGDHTGSTYNGYSATGRLAVVLAHNDCDAAFIMSLRTGSSGSGSTYTESGLDRSPDAYIIDEVRSDCNQSSPNGCTVRWTGYEVHGDTTNYGGNWGTSGTTVSWSSASITEVAVVGMIGSSVKNIASWSTRSGGNSAPASAFGSISSFAMPCPIGSSVGSVDTDWEAFLDSPAAVCTAGDRYKSLDPTLAVSAVEGAVVSFGVPNPGVSEGGYSGGKLFIGAA